jgi:hypothetical protein
MYQARSQFFNVTMGAFFAQSIPFTQSKPELLAGRLSQRFASTGLRPVHIRCREGDRLFDYDLTFALFNRQATCRIAADKLEVSFQGGRDAKDVGIVKDSLLALLDCVADRQPVQTFLEGGVHAALKTKEEREQLLAKFGNAAAGIPSGGVIAYIPNEVCGEIRFLLERSTTAPESIFLSWSTQPIAKPTPEALAKLLQTGLEIAAKYEVTLEG